MSGGEYSRPKLNPGIDRVKDLIEGCIQRYINKSECKNALELQNQIDPHLTEIIWNEIEKQNEEFFRAYYVRLVLIEQIRKFNHLLERQVEWMRTVPSSRVPAQMHTHDPSLDLDIGSQASKLAEDMQKLHNFGSSSSSILPSLHGYGFMDAPFCDTQNIEMYYGAPKNIEPSRTMNLQQFGSSRFQPLTPRMGGYVPYLAPQNIELYDDAGPSSNTGHFQENVCVSRYDPKFASCQYSGGPRNREYGTMTRTDMKVIGGEAGNLGLNPGPYGCFVDLAALMGDASIGCDQSNKSN